MYSIQFNSQVNLLVALMDLAHEPTQKSLLEVGWMISRWDIQICQCNNFTELL